MNTINNFKDLLKTNNIDAYIVPTSDYHMSEYICDYFKSRKYLSGFTGSAGTLVVTQNDARLWTDGRYFIQAQNELKDSGITLMKMGQPNVMTIEEYLEKNLSENQVLAYDAKVMPSYSILGYKEKLNGVIFKDISLIDKIWSDRPSLPNSVLYEIDEIFSGESTLSKIDRIRTVMNEKFATIHIISSLEDQAWLYNMRANDILYTPVFLAFSIITKDKTILFIDNKKLTKDIKNIFTHNNIEIRNYNDVYKYIQTLENESVLLDKKTCNYALLSSISETNKIIDSKNPTYLFKCIKNEVEIQNTVIAHQKDGAAMVRFIKHLKQEKSNLTEISASDYLEEQRKMGKGFIELSFNTIAAYKEHGAMMHYSSTSSSDVNLCDGSFFLVDSGAHYLEGTTDITRTFAMGEITNEMKLHYTTVLKSVIALSQAVFLKGCKGMNLDILARGPIWKLLIDYKCGTGHGVGHILSVHEGPNGFRWQVVPERDDSAILLPGMITTNEPGIYLEDLYGIRLENELLTVPHDENEFGTFYKFQTLTCCPFDIESIDISILNNDEINWLNNYHQFVYDSVSTYLTTEENAWLKEYTKPL